MNLLSSPDLLRPPDPNDPKPLWRRFHPFVYVWGATAIGMFLATLPEGFLPRAIVAIGSASTIAFVVARPTESFDRAKIEGDCVTLHRGARIAKTYALADVTFASIEARSGIVPFAETNLVVRVDGDTYQTVGVRFATRAAADELLTLLAAARADAERALTLRPWNHQDASFWLSILRCTVLGTAPSVIIGGQFESKVITFLGVAAAFAMALKQQAWKRPLRSWTVRAERREGDPPGSDVDFERALRAAWDREGTTPAPPGYRTSPRRH